jgi:DNA-binding NarL/FixJ family response regulator
VVEAATGNAGLHLFHSQLFDCVVLELDLPDMSGFEVLVKVVSDVYHPEVAVIILTQSTNRSILELSLKTGAQAALHKTTTSADVLNTAIMNAISTVQRERLAASLPQNPLRPAV